MTLDEKITFADQLRELKRLKAEIVRLNPPDDVRGDLLEQIGVCIDEIATEGRMHPLSFQLATHNIRLALIPYDSYED